MSGKIGSGKDAAYAALNKCFPGLIKQVCFADRLKETVSTLTGCDLELFYTREGKALIPSGFSCTIGTLLQKLGVSLRESISEDIWCNVVLKGTNVTL